MPEETTSFIRLPVNARAKDDTIRTITISADDGISALYNTTKKNIATYLFSTKKWTMATARKWIQEHQHTTKMIKTIGEELNKLGLDLSWRKVIRDIKEEDKRMDSKYENRLALAEKVIASRDMVSHDDAYQDVPPRQNGPKAPKKVLDETLKSDDVEEVGDKQTPGTKKPTLKVPPSVEPGLWELGARKFLEWLDMELEKLQAGGAYPGGEGSQGAGTFGTDVGYKKKTPKEAKEASKTGEKSEEEETEKGGPGSGNFGHSGISGQRGGSSRGEASKPYRETSGVEAGQEGYIDYFTSHGDLPGALAASWRSVASRQGKVPDETGEGVRLSPTQRGHIVSQRIGQYYKKSGDSLDLEKGGIGSGKYAVGENSHGFGLVKRLHNLHQQAIEAHKCLTGELSFMKSDEETYQEKITLALQLKDRIYKIRTKLRNVEVRYPINKRKE